MKKTLSKKKIILFVIAVILVFLITVAVLQWDNIQAIWLFLTHDADQIDAMLKDREAEIDDVLNGLQQTEEAPENNSGKSLDNSPPSSSSPVVPNYSVQRTRINEIISEIFGLRSKYTVELEDMHQSATHEFWASGNITMANKQDVAYKYIDAAVDMEKVCDAQMKSLLSELKSLLNEIGNSTQVVDDISYMYAQEKQLKKAQLMEILNAEPSRNSN